MMEYVVVEFQHAAEQLKDHLEMRTAVLRIDLHDPLTADIEHTSVQLADLTIMLVIKHVVVADIHPVPAQAVELGAPILQILQQKEGIVLRNNRPFARRALEMHDLIVLVEIETERGHWNTLCAVRELEAPTQHHIEGRT